MKTKDMMKMLGMRFARAFVSGGLATMVLELSNKPDLGTITDTKVWAVSLIIGFLTGGLMAIEKAIRTK